MKDYYNCAGENSWIYVLDVSKPVKCTYNMKVAFSEHFMAQATSLKVFNTHNT